ncbi:MAG: Na/Pi cotransporter family protein [Chloroflexi bacterium]|nr:Na/Pi cotransporter family protein [Chloroflexota bacterium]
MLSFIQVLGGLALFLFGISMLSSGMEKLAGNQIQKWLDRVTSNRLKSAAFGAVGTAVLQSSGLLMVMMIGLINANLMTVEQSVGVMLGQEIGTTLTAQIVAFKVGDFSLLLVVVGLVLMEFFPNRDWRKYGQIFMGLGLVLVGMSFMSEALGALVEIPWVGSALTTIGQRPWIGLLTGIVVTSITQSSSAVMSIVVAMGMSDVITLQGAVGVMLGANIGSCITGLTAAIRLSPTARQASFAQILINVIGVLLFLPFISQFAGIVENTAAQLPRQIANAHTIFNVVVSILMFPFVPQIAAVAKRLAPADPEKEKAKVTQFIDEMQYAVPAVALNEAARELFHLGEVTSEMIELSCNALINLDTTNVERVLVMEDKVVDMVTKELEEFVDTLMRSDLSRAQHKRVFQIKNLLHDIERVGDMAEDIALYARERAATMVPFSDEATRDLIDLSRNAHENYRQALIAFRDGDAELADKVCKAESEFDLLYWKAREMHIRRIKAGLCLPEADVIFTETLRLLERISDHADNLGISVSRSANQRSPAATP